MFVRSLKVAAAFGAAASLLTACASADARLAAHAPKHDGQFVIVLDDDDDFEISGLSSGDIRKLHIEINEEVSRELANARVEIKQAMDEIRVELEAMKIEVGQTEDRELRNAVMVQVTIALEEAEISLQEALQQLEETEAQFHGHGVLHNMVAPVAPVAPIAPVAPVAPIAPVAPVAPAKPLPLIDNTDTPDEY